MKTGFLSLFLVVCGSLSAPGVEPERQPVAPPRAAAPAPGVELAKSISTVTGVAISPLLGAGAVGAWRYWQARPTDRATLPWYAQPWFWGTALTLVGLVFLKDALGPAMPKLIKKPLDVLEVFENKASALVAAGIVIPLLLETLRDDRAAMATLSGAGFAAIDLGWAGYLLVGLLALTAFFVVWLASHVINILILLSPWATVDAALKATRLAVLASVVVTTLVSPWVGAAWSLLLIAIACCVAGWSLRLTVFGTVFAWDLLTLAHRRFSLATHSVRAFTARRLGPARVRTLGRLIRDGQGELWFAYRPWLVFPERTIKLPGGRHAVGRGLLHDDLLSLHGSDAAPVLRLPPRTRTHADDLTQIFGLGAPRDVGLRRGLKALFAWLNGQSVPSAPRVPEAALAVS